MVILCAGHNRARSFSLEDAFCAGAMVEVMLSREDARPEPRSDALAARRLYRSYRRSARAVFLEAGQIASLTSLGLGRDLDFCAQRNRFAVVPRLEHSDRETLRVVGR